MADNFSKCRTIEDFSKFKGIKGVYILQNVITGILKIGRTYNLGKRVRDLNEFTSPTLCLSFFPTEDYDKIEKLFHKQHRKYQVSTEYFYLDSIYVFDWLTSLGLSTTYYPSIGEVYFQKIRAEWLLHIRKNSDFISLKDYINVSSNI